VYQLPFLLGQGCEQVQHERVDVGSQFSDDERDLVGHQAGYEMHVATEPVELRHDDRAFVLLGKGERGQELRAHRGVVTFAGLDLGELGQDFEVLVAGEREDLLLLAIETKA